MPIRAVRQSGPRTSDEDRGAPAPPRASGDGVSAPYLHHSTSARREQRATGLATGCEAPWAVDPSRAPGYILPKGDCCDMSIYLLALLIGIIAALRPGSTRTRIFLSPQLSFTCPWILLCS